MEIPISSIIWIGKREDPSYLQKLRDTGHTIDEISKMCGVTKYYVSKVTKSRSKPTLLSGKPSAISVPSIILREARINVKKELYGRWFISDEKIFLQVSDSSQYTGSDRQRRYKLIRQRNTNARTIYLPEEIAKGLTGKYRWESKGKGLLKLEKVIDLEKRRYRLNILDSFAIVRIIEVSGNLYLLFPQINGFEKRCQIGIGSNFLLILPDKKGLKITRRNGYLAVRIGRLKYRVDQGDYKAYKAKLLIMSSKARDKVSVKECLYVDINGLT